ncbi:hypothetical protein T492DRAFT_253696 [Pavlovales sp. CCMP2436]|nr:hypothetical protein T492DRAFT_253696 [Pavlovales sp. CCMP2436]
MAPLLALLAAVAAARGPGGADLAPRRTFVREAGLAATALAAVASVPAPARADMSTLYRPSDPTVADLAVTLVAHSTPDIDAWLAQQVQQVRSSGVLRTIACATAGGGGAGLLTVVHREQLPALRELQVCVCVCVCACVCARARVCVCVFYGPCNRLKTCTTVGALRAFYQAAQLAELRALGLVVGKVRTYELGTSFFKGSAGPPAQLRPGSGILFGAHRYSTVGTVSV